VDRYNIVGPGEVKVPWGFGWAFFWRNLLISLAFSFVIWVLTFIFFLALGISMGSWYS